MDRFYHRTNNIDGIASGGRIKALAHLARNTPDMEVEVEPGAFGSNVGGLSSSRTTMKASDAYNMMNGTKDVDNVFLTHGTLPSESYGRYIIEKRLKSPTLNRKLNLIANEFITPRELSVRSNAIIYAPDDEVDDLKSRWSSLTVRPRSSLDARDASVLDIISTLKDKLTKQASVAGIAGLLGAGGLAYANRDMLLGYHKVYHGTSGRAAEAITREGLDPNWGGRGGAAENAERGDFVDNSKNKVHLTKLRRVARGYADTVDPEEGSILSAYIPHKQWEEASVDNDASWGMNANKRVAATTTDPVTVQNLKARALDYLNPENLGEYYSSESGRERATAAVGITAAGGLAAGAVTMGLLKLIR